MGILELIILDRVSDVAFAVWIKEYLGSAQRAHRLLFANPGAKPIPFLDRFLSRFQVSKTNKTIGTRLAQFIRTASQYQAFENLACVAAEQLRKPKQSIRVF